MVVFEDGVARKSEYRRFAVRGLAAEGTADDVRAIHEVVSRRFRRYLDERSQATDVELEIGAADDLGRQPGIDPDTGKPRKFSYPPNLLLVDGGAPQVAAAQAALDELGIDDVAVAGLAKRLEEVWQPGKPDPVILPRTSEGLYLLQRVRDEAHRFAITYHRQRRSRRMVDSLLDQVPGLGEVRRTALLRRFGSLKRLRAASVEELAEVPGIGPQTAQAIVTALADAPEPGPAVDTATGEILT
jgi:excinuclease ABC subunit C